MRSTLPLSASFALCLFALACGSGDETDASKNAPASAGAAGKAGASGQGGGLAGFAGGLAGMGSSLGPEVCGDGLDNNSNGLSDEGCPCNPGQTQSCFFGPADKAGKGACKLGVQVCLQSGSGEVTSTGWGLCEGSKGPVVEVCGDSVDNNCDGAVDEGCCKPGESVACSSECGDGQQVCQGGKLSACQVSTPKPGAPASCGGGACKEGETVSCSNECGDGQQVCQAGKLSACKVDAPRPGAPASCGSAACKEGEVVVCSNECGDGQQVCSGGKLSTCKVTVPKPNAPTSCQSGECADGDVVACQSECGDGQQVCQAGKLSPCNVDTPKPGAPASCGSGSCKEGETVACSNECGEGQQVCQGGKLSACQVSSPKPGAPASCGAACQEGEVVACSNECGDGVQVCVSGVLLACKVDAPKPGAPASCGGAACSVDVPCNSACGAGVQKCVGGVLSVCDAPLPSAEICDGLDNNCDGKIDESASSSLQIAPNPFTFPATAVGASATQLFTLTPSGGPVAGVSARMMDTYTFSGGSYPGLNGTCGAVIDGPCTVEIEFRPKHACDYRVPVRFSQPPCGGPSFVDLELDGSTTSSGPLEDVCPTTYEMFVSASSGDDANDGLSPQKPKKTLTGALAASQEGVRFLMAEGVYSGAVAVVGCGKLFGGYDPTFTQRDPKAHPTTLTAATALTFAAGSPAFSGFHQVDGLTISNTAPDGSGLVTRGGLIVRESNISGATSGISLYGNDCVEISDSVISSGPTSGATSVALDVRSCSDRLLIQRNKISVSGTASDYALFLNQNSNGVVLKNQIFSTGTGVYFNQNGGLFAQNNPPLIFDGNQVYGEVKGVHNHQNGDSVVSRNNWVYGFAVGIESFQDSVAWANNTIGSATTAALFPYGGGAWTNNLLFNSAGGGVAISVVINSGVNGLPKSLENNVSVGFGVLLRNTFNMMDFPGGAEVNALNSNQKRIKGNALSALSPAEVFVSLAGPDGKVETLDDNDWRLLTGDPAITQGGKDASGNDCGSYFAPISCGDVKTDFDGAPRSVPYSVGAFEK